MELRQSNLLKTSGLKYIWRVLKLLSGATGLRRVNRMALIAIFIPSFLGSSQVALQPIAEEGGQIVAHEHYSLCYHEDHEQAAWVFYELTKDEVKGGWSRSNDFREDDNIATGSAALADYRGSGFDRGHLAPAADMAFSQTAMSESFFMSNMSPQHPSFNRGFWKKLEGQVRKWAYARNAVWVASGPVFRNNKGNIGSNAVTVPGGYYKVLLDTVKRTTIAFLMPNRKCSGSVYDYVVPVDSVETLTNIDFNSYLPDGEEVEMERRKNTDDWPRTDVYIEKAPSKNGTTAKRCKGTTNAGKQCKRRTKNASGRCWQHE